jgi:hypothetical protein
MGFSEKNVDDMVMNLLGDDNCSLSECFSPRYAVGFCKSHYYRFNRYGDPRAGKYKLPKELCDFEGCPYHGTIQGAYVGYCSGHAGMLKRGKPLRALKTEHRNEQGERHCPGCLKWICDEEWHDGKTTNRCNRCEKDKYLKDRYSVSIDWYEQQLESQSGRCYLCGSEPGEKSLTVDHDHSCCSSETRACGKCVRKLLCQNCNHGLGNARDDTNLLRKWIDYLEEHRN